MYFYNGGLRVAGSEIVDFGLQIADCLRRLGGCEGELRVAGFQMQIANFVSWIESIG